MGVAVANQKIEYDEKTGTYRVPVVVTCNRNNSSINITSKDLYLDLELEDSASLRFVPSGLTSNRLVI